VISVDLRAYGRSGHSLLQFVQGDQCMRCGHQAISYNSCRNRYCARCQGNAGSRWLAERRAELLPVSYFHIVFTLPHELSALTLQNKRLLYDLLFRASAATLLELASDGSVRASVITAPT
jgi:Transposase zinc-binding domain